MLAITDIKLQGLATHYVGNKATGDELVLSKELVSIDTAEVTNMLLQFFLTPFREAGSFHFWHPSDIRQNEICFYATDLFKCPDDLLANSRNIARHLYDVTDLPHIKNGELHIALFTGVPIDGMLCDAIGIYKTTSEDRFLQVRPIADSFEFVTDTGINPDKMDKGCLIINTQREAGYKVFIVDRSSRDGGTQFWKDTFLKVRAADDDYHRTNDYMKLCKDFVVEHIPTEFEVSKTDQIGMLNQTAAYFKKNEQFSRQEFVDQIFKQPDVKESFANYSRLFIADYETNLPDEFDISAPAVKKQARLFKSVLKLDKNFHVYVHGNPDLIERGYDPEVGLNYYKIFFENEA